MLQYNTQADNILSLFKNKISLLNQGEMKFDLVDYNDESISLKSKMHIVSIKLKQEGNLVNVIVSFKFDAEDGKGSQFNENRGNKAIYQVVDFINKNLDSIELTENAVIFLEDVNIKIQQGANKATLQVIGGIVLFFIIFGMIWYALFSSV